MTYSTTTIKGLIIIEPRVFDDARGYFMESYHSNEWDNALGVSFVQDNESLSKKGVIRALHFQNPPFAQDKLVRVVRGSVLDIAVDLRRNSPTYGEHFKIVLSAANKKQFFIPKGFAHGFAALENDTIFSYKCSAYYCAEAEESIRWNDPDIGINWTVSDPILSKRDAEAPFFATFESKFNF